MELEKIVNLAFQNIKLGLSKIAAVNHELLITNISNQHVKLKRDRLTSIFFTDTFFNRNSRDWDNRYSVPIVLKGNKLGTISNSHPIALAPVPDEEKFYLRLHPSEPTYSNIGEEFIPSRDFLLSSYPWENLFSHNLLSEIANDDNWENIIESYFTDFIRLNLNLDKVLNREDITFDICFFGIYPYPGNSYRHKIKLKELINLFVNIKELYKGIEEKGFDFFSFKIENEYNTRKEKINKYQADYNYKANINNTYVLFVDGLDLSILSEKQYSGNFKALESIISKSINYRSFTSSGSWTYPCLDSMHKGISPYYNFSIYRADPMPRCIPREVIKSIKINQEDVNGHYIVKSLLADDYINNSKFYLTRILERAGYQCLGIKSARNHGWREGLSHSIDYSFENCSINSITSMFDEIKTISNSSKKKIYFIDIDCLHRSPEFNNNYLKDNNLLDSTSWIDYSSDKYKRLLGISDKNNKDKSRYIQKLIKVESILSKLIEKFDPSDNLILFSDHGSTIFPLEFPNPYQLPLRSSLLSERIWKPSLLVYSPNLNKDHLSISQELVSTVDLYSIILHLANVEEEYPSKHSLLPKSLGGHKSRNASYTFGYSVDRRDKNSKIVNLELAERLSYSKGNLYHFNSSTPRDFDNISSFLKDIFPEASYLV